MKQNQAADCHIWIAGTRECLVLINNLNNDDSFLNHLCLAFVPDPETVAWSQKETRHRWWFSESPQSVEQHHRHQQQLEEDGLVSVEERCFPPATAHSTVSGNMQLRKTVACLFSCFEWRFREKSLTLLLSFVC